MGDDVSEILRTDLSEAGQADASRLDDDELKLLAECVEATEEDRQCDWRPSGPFLGAIREMVERANADDSKW
jgi:hypothetical protein